MSKQRPHPAIEQDLAFCPRVSYARRDQQHTPQRSSRADHELTEAGRYRRKRADADKAAIEDYLRRVPTPIW